jgi:hypothetical protein
MMKTPFCFSKLPRAHETFSPKINDNLGTLSQKGSSPLVYRLRNDYSVEFVPPFCFKEIFNCLNIVADEANELEMSKVVQDESKDSQKVRHFTYLLILNPLI